MNKNLIYIIYCVPEHCGHEVIERILTDKQKAIKICHELNLDWAKYMSSWDGTRTLFHIITKELDSQKEFDFNCDVCDFSYSYCECFEHFEYKTEENYEKYWSKERAEHNHNHSHSDPNEDCKFCQEDKTLWWIPALKKTKQKRGST